MFCFVVAKPETPSNELNDEDRLAKVKEWNELLNSRSVLQDREDIVGYEKLKEDKRMTDVSPTSLTIIHRDSHFIRSHNHALCSFQEMTLLAKVLLEDAKRRINKKESLPEPEDQMTAPVKKLVQQGVSVLCTHSVILSSDLYGFVVKCFLY